MAFEVTVQTSEQEAGAAALRDVALDPADGDLLFVDGDEVWLSGNEAIASDLKSALTMFGPGEPRGEPAVAGEWFLDTSEGLDYWGKVLGQKLNRGEVAQHFREVAEAVPGVLKATVELELTGRILTVTVKATTDTGEILAVGTFNGAT